MRKKRESSEPNSGTPVKVSARAWPWSLFAVKRAEAPKPSREQESSRSAEGTKLQPEADKGEGGGSGKLSDVGASPKPPKKRRRSLRFRLGVALARTTIWGFFGLIGLSFVAYLAFRTFVKSRDLALFLKRQVEEQTGGRLEIEDVEFDPLRGLTLRRVEFYPPVNARGYLHGDQVAGDALAKIDTLDVAYSIPQILIGRVHIKAMRLIRPQLHLAQADGAFNFEPILAYRKAHFPPKPNEDVRPKPDERTPTGQSLVPIDPKLLYMPIELLAQNIGIDSLKVELTRTESGKTVQTLKTNGLSFDMGLHWLGLSSRIWFSMLSPVERPLEVEIKGAKDKALQPQLLASSALSLRFELKDFQRVALDFATRLKSLETPAAGFKDIGAFAKVRLKAAEDFKGLAFEEFRVELADALLYELAGNVAAKDWDFREIELRLKQKLELDLAPLASLAQPFVPGFKASGEISVDELKVDGVVEPAKLGEITKGAALPYVSGVIWLEDVKAEVPGTGAQMEPMSGALSLGIAPGLASAGSQVDISLDLTMPMLELEAATPKTGRVKASVENLVAKVTARALYPELALPLFKANLEVEHVRASGDRVAKVDVPLFLDMDAEGKKDLSKAALSLNMDLPELAEISLTADCQSKCARFRSSLATRLDSLKKLHSMVLPLGAALGLKEVMPTSLTGGIDLQANARGKLPDPFTALPDDFLTKGDVHFNTQLSVAKLSAQLPLFKTDLKNFETRILMAGSLKEQKIDLNQKFDALVLELPAKDKKPALPVSLSRFSFDTSVTNQIEGALKLGGKPPLGQLRTSVGTKLYLGKVAAEGLIPRPIADIQVDFKGEQAHLTDVKIEEFMVKLPVYGAALNVKADAGVGPDFLPTRLFATVSSEVSPGGAETLPAGINTQGRVLLDLKIASSDLKSASVEGKVGFDKFHVRIPAKDEQGPPLLLVEDMRGQIPFKQTVKLPDLAAMKKAAGEKANSGEKLASTEKSPEEGLAETHVPGAKPGAKKTEGPYAAPKKVSLPVVEVAEDEEKSADAIDRDLAAASAHYFAKTNSQNQSEPNVAALVDYGSIRPFYPGRKPLAIKRLEAANLELSNMEFDLELRQSWFALNQFMINFLGGKLQGDFQFAFDPEATDPKQIPMSLRTSLHMTNLDTRKLLDRFPNLKGKASSGWNLLSNPYLDGTVHVNYDFRSNDIAGGVEVTSIGKEQLKMMLYYVDPFEQNPTIGDIRKALSIGEVRQVSIPLKNGEVGMSVDVRIFGAPIPTPKLTRFPISQIIQNFKDQAGGGVKEGAKEPPRTAQGLPPAQASLQ